MKDGYYYLHTNGSLIFKKFEPESDSPFVKKIWTIDTSQRSEAWRIILESLALGADQSRIKELAGKWSCNLKDLPLYLAYVPNPSALQKDGLEEFLKLTGVDKDKWFDWLAATPPGKEPDWDSMPQEVTP